MIITIDGLDGAGKSTLAKSLSEKLGYEYIYLMLKAMIVNYKGIPFVDFNLDFRFYVKN